MRARLTRRVWGFLEGTQAWADTRSGRPSHENPDDLSLMRKVRDAPTRKDGSAIVDLTPGEVEALLSYAEAMERAAADNAWEPDGLADLNAARGMLRRIYTYLANPTGGN